jgi:hypothetical protein
MSKKSAIWFCQLRLLNKLFDTGFVVAKVYLGRSKSADPHAIIFPMVYAQHKGWSETGTKADGHSRLSD